MWNNPWLSACLGYRKFYEQEKIKMKNYKMKFSNALGSSVWNKVKLTHLPNKTTNSVINPSIFKRECAEYDAGILQQEHELYLGDRYA